MSDFCTDVTVLDFDPDDCIAPAVEVEIVAPEPNTPAAENVVATNGWTYRDYQERCFLAIDQAFTEFRRILIVLATGLGKTVIFTHIARQVVSRGGKVLIIAHSEELLDQAGDKLKRSTGLDAAKEKASEFASVYDNVVLASVQTLARPNRLKLWAPDHFDLIIVDEAHRSRAKSYEDILAHFTGKALGVTATADRGDKKSLSEIYERVAFEFNLLEAVLQGWLVRPVVKTLPLEIDLKGVRTSRTAQGSDYDLGEVSHRIEPFIHEIARLMAQETHSRGQGIVFMPSVATARMMAESLVNVGLNAEYVSGDCDDRTEKIERFKTGKTRVLVNAMLLIEGFDHDGIDWISVLRPTKIRSLYVQAVGRGTRPLNTIAPMLNGAGTAEERRKLIAESAKPTLLILDFLWLTEKLDLIAPAHLVARNAQVAEQMQKEHKDGDLIDVEGEAERDLLESLRKAMEKNKKKKARTIDPLAFAVSVNDETIQAYEPSSRWEFAPPTPAQLKILEKSRMDLSKVTTSGLASKLIEKIEQRDKLGLCTIGQMTFLQRLGFKDAALMSRGQAGRIISSKTKVWELRRQRPQTNITPTSENLPLDHFN